MVAVSYRRQASRTLKATLARAYRKPMSQNTQMTERPLDHDKDRSDSDEARASPQGLILLTFVTSRGLGNGRRYPCDTHDIVSPGTQAGHNFV